MEIKEVRNGNIDSKGEDEEDKADDTKNSKDHMESCVVLKAIIYNLFCQFFKLFFITFKNKC